jgi:hypothetical protein
MMPSCIWRARSRISPTPPAGSAAPSSSAAMWIATSTPGAGQPTQAPLAAPAAVSAIASAKSGGASTVIGLKHSVMP